VARGARVYVCMSNYANTIRQSKEESRRVGSSRKEKTREAEDQDKQVQDSTGSKWLYHSSRT